MKKRIISLLLAVMMILTLMPTAALADTAATSGTCGDNLTWTLVDGTLTISGTGAMSDYCSSNSYDFRPYAPWRNDKKSIASVVIGSGVTTIGANAFNGCSSLTNVTIPSSVTTIGERAFSSCSGLTSVTIPDGVITIGESAFGWCSGLTSVAIPNGVTEIGKSAFYGCSGLMNVMIPNSVITIGGYAFCDCSSLTSVTIPNSVTTIGVTAFRGCSALMSITIPDGVTSIGGCTFEYCSSLQSVTIPDGVTSIGRYAFGWCSGLTSIILPNSVATIGGYTFCKCSSLTSVTIPDSVTEISKGAFSGCDSIADVYYGGTREQWDGIDIGEYNEPLLNANIHFAGEDKPVVPLVKDGQFSYNSTLTEETASYTYHYDENWFNSDSNIYNHELARMSLRMAMSGFQASGTDGAANIKALLKDIGFADKNIVAKYPKPGRDTIGYTVASKQLSDGSTLIAAVVRSGGYGSEWASNFTIGTTNEHQGFEEAASHVMSGIEQYIADKGITGNIKFWVSGYSRGAATANMIGQKLDVKAKESSTDGIEKSNIYAYCFECPRNMIKIWDNTYYAQYDNIFNIINYADVVTKVAMSDWGYTRYGVDLNLPSAEQTSSYSSASTKMLKHYAQIASMAEASTEVKDAAKLMKAQGGFTDDIASALASYFWDNGTYVLGYQEDMRDLLAETMGNEDLEVGTVFSAIAGLNAFPILHPIITGKILLNTAEIGHAHYPELCLSWMDALTGRTDYVSSMIRKFCINCPVDVNVYDSDGNLVAQIVNDEVVEIEGSFISIYIDENGQKRVDLPTDAKYTIELIAMDDGTVSYQVTEVDTNTNEVKRLVNCYDVDIKAGDVLTGDVEKTSDGEKAQYGLSRLMEDETSTPIAPTSDETAGIARSTLVVTAEDGGTVSGGGLFVKGQFARVTATANEGSEFIGWYNGDEKVSDEAEYRLRMENDTELTAKFHTHEYKDGVCDCGEKDPDYVKPSTPVHSHSYTATVVAPTCTEQGYTLHKCSCGANYKDTYVKAAGHTTELQNVKLATCTEVGYSGDKVCTVCKQTIEKGTELKATGHSYTDVVTAPTCLEKGFTTHTCACGDVKVDTYVDALGHDFKDGACTRCGAKDVTFNPFKDVDKTTHADYYDAILWAYYNDITKGTNAAGDMFSPELGCTRAQIVTFLWRQSGAPVYDVENPFTDVSKETHSDYYNAIMWAYKTGVIKGVSDTEFAPDKVCIRAEIVTMLYRLDGENAVKTGTQFTDLTQVWYKDAIAWAVAEKITKGTSDTTFTPDAPCTRAQTVTFLYRTSHKQHNIAKHPVDSPWGAALSAQKAFTYRPKCDMIYYHCVSGE